MKILVDKIELEKKLALAKNGKLIELCIVPAETDSGSSNPAFLHIGAIHNNGFYEDLESVDEHPMNLLIELTA